MAGTEREDIPELVGLRAVSAAAEGGSSARLKVGMRLYEGDGQEPSGKGIGKITSATTSPLFEGDIALARLADGQARIGSLIRAMDRETAALVDVKVGPPRFYLPGKERRHG
jgi:glycine cleavage system aminomethyltransferase T